MFKILSTYICWKKYIKCNIWRVAVRPSYIWDARFLKVKGLNKGLWPPRSLGLHPCEFCWSGRRNLLHSHSTLIYGAVFHPTHCSWYEFKYHSYYTFSSAPPASSSAPSGRCAAYFSQWTQLFHKDTLNVMTCDLHLVVGRPRRYPGCVSVLTEGVVCVRISCTAFINQY